MKILLLDIETAPNIATVWGLYDQTISSNQLLETSYILCWAAKWLDREPIMWERSIGRHGRSRLAMLRTIHRLLSTADAVVHYNGKRFDMGVINKEFLLHGMSQPSHYHQLDLYQVVKAKFRFTSSKLDFICKALKLGGKEKHEGHELWLKCMEDNKQAWETMKRYNQHDVYLLEKLFYRLKPWLDTHPNKTYRKVAEMVLNAKAI